MNRAPGKTSSMNSRNSPRYLCRHQRISVKPVTRVVFNGRSTTSSMCRRNESAALFEEYLSMP